MSDFRIKTLAKKASDTLDTQTLSPESKVKQIGLIYGIYRILISIFLIMGNYVTNEALKLRLTYSLNPLSSGFEYLLLGGYVVFSVVALGTLYKWQANIRRQLLIGLFVDMVVLTLLLYSGAAKDLQIVLLYMIATAASFMMLKFRRAIAVTFVAILSLVFQQAYYAYIGINSLLSLSDAILLSLSLLAVGFLSFSVSQRLAITEQLAQDNAKEADRLNAINEEVIKNITSGVMVIGQSGRLRLINRTAELLLRLPVIGPPVSRSAYIFEAERLIFKHHQTFADWYRYKNDNLTFQLTIPQKNEEPERAVRIHKKPLDGYGVLLILEDLSREESYAEQLKLASLGQLSASIAHEIRNPLGAIAQASELLMEEDATSANAELYEIIYSQTRRVNRIVEDVMRLSRQESPHQELIDLKQWIPAFLKQHFSERQIATSFGQVVHIFFDPHHLEQIFINLIDNALRHTIHTTGFPDVLVKVHSGDNVVFVDVLDNGEGVKPEYLGQLFNPFFTKSAGGTGLGLYLSRSFSEANHARLIYLKDNGQKTCFRLIAPISEIGGVY